MDELPRFRQRRWEHAPLSDDANHIRTLQARCTKLSFMELPNYGYGSDLQVWASRICEAAQRDASLVALPSGALSCPSACQTLSFSSARSQCKSPCHISTAEAAPWIWDDQPVF